MNSLRAWLRLVRPANAFIAAAAVWLGWFSLRFRPEWELAAWGSLSMALLAAAGNVDNDVRDLAIDRINRPDRPLPAGLIAPGAARAGALLLFALAVLAAWIGTPVHGLLVLCMAGLLLAYNRRLKGLPLIGNVAVALLCALAVYFTEFPLPPRNILPAMAFAFLATLARELVKDAEDVEGDRAAGLRTFAIAAGTGNTRKLAFAAAIGLLLLLPLPVAYFGYRWPYAVLSALLAGPFLLASLWELAKPDADFNRCQRHLKWVMIGGMVSLWAGVVGR